jgi:cell division protein FtsZ
MRMRLADAGIAELQRYVDTLIVIPNQNLFRIANEKTTFAEAFAMADQVLHSGVRSITDLMVLPGLINLDFADVRTVMTEMGKAMMGTGEATGEDRALMASQNAIANPLLDEVSLKGAKAVLVNVTGGLDMTLLEVDEAANAISDQVDPEANIIFGAAFDPSLEGKIRVSVVATGMDGASIAAIEPKAYAPAQPAVAPQRPAAAAQPAEVAPPVARTAPPVLAPRTAPIVEPLRSAAVQAPAAQPYVSPYAQPAREPIIERPAPRYEAEAYDPPLEAAAPPAPVEPQIIVTRQALQVQPAAVAEPVKSEEEGPLFPQVHYGEDRERKGFFSLFGGRGRQDEPPPLRDYRNDPTPVLEARAQAAAAPVQTPPAQPATEAGEDLEIPSFLRRLAN